ncbi:Non-structural maintenance of chromosomes element 1 [Chytridiales sp. JEL 0842]|nr:Non-structural maintenance of chromosomes element 1 [Chytridiales sp. JEL 0842]
MTRASQRLSQRTRDAQDSSSDEEDTVRRPNKRQQFAKRQREAASAAGRQRREEVEDEDAHPSQAVNNQSIAAQHAILTIGTITPVHRQFMHTWMSVRFDTYENATKLYNDCCTFHRRRFDADDFPEFVKELNEMLHFLDLSLKTCLSPDTGVKHIGLINTNADEISQLATTLQPNELNFVKRLISLIVNEDDEVFETATSKALRISSEVKPPITKKSAETLIASLVSTGWFNDINGYISLSMRALLELKTYLKDEFGELIVTCTACQEIVTTNYERCSVGECTGRLHKYCAQKIFTGANNKVCPAEGCGVQWRGEGPIVGGGRRGGGGQRSRRKIVEDTVNEEEEDGQGQE